MSNKQFEKGLTETRLTVQNIENDRVTLLFGEHSLDIPTKLCPKDLAIGSEVVLTISSEADHLERKERNAKELLNEILNIE